MHEAAADSEKPLKPLRRSKIVDPSRQVHFHEAPTKLSTKKPPTTAEETSTSPSNNNSNQPESHPQVGQPPLPHLNCPPSGQWFTAADPTRSVNLPGQPAAVFRAPAHQHPQQIFHQHSSFHPHPHQHAGTAPQPFITYISPYGPAPPPNMGDYQNCVPPPTGVNFQPPVPDTTFGPIPHVYVPRFDGHAGVPAVNHPGSVPMGQAGYFVQQPGFAPVSIPGHQQPVIFNGQAYIPAGTPTPGIPGQPIFSTPVMATPGGIAGPPVGQPGTVPIISGNCGNTIPDVSGLGRTPNEETLRQVEFAYNNRLFEPQEFKPADDDPSRFYYVREVDGNWTQRNRFTIDHMGDCRWYVTDEGWFYAVRLPD